MIHNILERLHQRGLIATPRPAVQPLTGGVSSDIWLIDDGRQKLVMKRALPKLRVADDWFADVSRNRHEQDFMDYVADFLPTAVPRLVHGDPDNGFFLMEYLGPEFANWKTLLLAGEANPEHARQAAEILASIHRHSWNDPEARARFATTAQFRQLRIDPYLVTTGDRHPPLRTLFHDEAERLANTQLCLVHGDYSPKNILISPERMVLLDCEVAWFGDPAFDVSFLLNHLLLKALHLKDSASRYLALADTAWQTYIARFTPEQKGGLEARVFRLLPMLMLARVDGKSPIEYLTDESKRGCVREFVTECLSRREENAVEFCRAWGKALSHFGATDRESPRTV
jgi:aminoglycoside phosphotransferase (APT) family kinase protein